MAKIWGMGSQAAVRCPGVMGQRFVDIKWSTLIPLFSQQVCKLKLYFYHFAVRDMEFLKEKGCLVSRLMNSSHFLGT